MIKQNKQKRNGENWMTENCIKNVIKEGFILFN